MSDSSNGPESGAESGPGAGPGSHESGTDGAAGAGAAGAPEGGAASNGSKVLRGAVAALQKRFAERRFAGSAAFVITGEGAVRVDLQGVRAVADAGADADADAETPVEVTLTADRATFEALLEGRLSPAAAFMSGRLRIDGDMGAAMRLGAALA